MRFSHKLIIPLFCKAISKLSPTGDSFHNSWFERFWRPVFGYCVSLAWLCHMLTICYVIISDNPKALEIITSLAETTSLWGVALGVLGISVVKSNRVPTKLSDKSKTIKQDKF